MANGRSCLIYELHLTNFSASPIKLLTLEVFGGNGTVPLASYRNETLEKLLFVVGSGDSAHNVRSIGGGRSAVIFLDLMLDSGTHPPAELGHRVSLSISRRKDGSGDTIAKRESLNRMQQISDGEKLEMIFTHWLVDARPYLQVASILGIHAWMRAGRKYPLYFF